MALQKEKELPNGAIGNYWKVVCESYDKQAKVCNWVLALYKDQATATARKPSLGLKKTFRCKATTEELMGNRTELAYEKIKEMVAGSIVNLLTGESRPDADLTDAVDV